MIPGSPPEHDLLALRRFLGLTLENNRSIFQDSECSTIFLSLTVVALSSWRLAVRSARSRVTSPYEMMTCTSWRRHLFLWPGATAFKCFQNTCWNITCMVSWCGLYRVLNHDVWWVGVASIVYWNITCMVSWCGLYRVLKHHVWWVGVASIVYWNMMYGELVWPLSCTETWCMVSWCGLYRVLKHHVWWVGVASIVYWNIMYGELVWPLSCSGSIDHVRQG